MVKLAIYIPTFNRVESLKNCIVSIADQIENKVVVYVANNCSDDGTKEYLDSLSYSWLQVKHRDKNIGGGYNQVLAWYLPVDAEFIWLIGDDDYLMPGAVKTLLAAIDQSDVDFVFCNTQAFPDNKRQQVMSMWASGKLPSGAIKGKLGHSFKTDFSNLIDPNVADSLLIEIMCLCVRKGAINKCMPRLQDDPQTFDDFGKLYTTATDPLLRCFSASTPSFYIHEPLTFNFWSGGNEWSWNYDHVFPIAILYMIDSYYKKNFIDKDKYIKLLDYYFRLMSGSIKRQIEETTTAKKFNEEMWEKINSAYKNLVVDSMSVVLTKQG